MNVRYRSQFKKDYRLLIKRGKDIFALDIVIDERAIPKPLPECMRDHGLRGEYEAQRRWSAIKNYGTYCTIRI